MGERYVVVMGAGSLREETGSTVPHEWTGAGVSVRCETTGTHVLHLAVAGGVIDTLYRSAAGRGLPLNGVQVRAEGSVDLDDEETLGIEYSVAVDSGLLPEDVDAILDGIDPVSDLPQDLHAGIAVRRTGHL